MLSKKNRASSEQIKKIFQKGRVVFSPNLNLRFIVGGGLKNTQISFIAPKTVAKSAVERNLLRRRGYSALGKQLRGFPAGLLGAIIFNKNSLTVFGSPKTPEYNPVVLIEDEIKTILNKIN